MQHRHYRLLALLLAGVCVGSPAAWAQSPTAIVKRSENRPLPSLARAAERSMAQGPRFEDRLRLVPNKPLKGGTRTQEGAEEATALSLQETQGTGTTSLLESFDGADNDDNGRVLGFRVAPPDTDGDVGEAYVVQMLNLVTTIFDKSGNIVSGPFASNAFWEGMGGLCEPYNQGDPIVVYDEAADRWMVSQFAFPDAFTSFAQCVAISQTSDPTGAYNRYEFSFDDIGFNDYPKHGIVTNSITMMANIFIPMGPFFNFGGTFLGVMDKGAMYAGQQAALIGFTIGTGEFGFIAADLDDPAGTAGFVPALFATAMSNSGQFDIWEIDVDWTNPSGATVGSIAAIPISPYDSDLCSASREVCIPQPGTTQRLEAISDRLMQRLQIRDFGTHRTMLAAHTVDVGNGRAGIRWYEMRETGGTWSLYQEGTYGPNDGKHRWMPSIAMNAAGDIGLGYLVSNGTTTYLSTAVAGQSAANSGTGELDAAEAVCVAGSGAQTGTGRAGDYSATVIDPVTDTFWHTNEYGPRTGDFVWASRFCEFAVTGGGTPPQPPNAPSNLVATAVSSSQIDMMWGDNSPDEEGFRIERSLSSGSGFSEIDVVGADVTSYSNTGLAASTTYYYRVQAFNADGDSDFTNEASATTQSDGGTNEPTSVHVELIVTGTENMGKGNKRGTATVTIHNDLGQPVSGATVAGTFSGTLRETRSGTTGSDGTVTLTTTETARGGVTVNFCVNSVSAALPYNPSDNSSAGYDCGGAAAKAGLTAASRSDVPGTFALEQNYPNPFNPATVIAFTLPEAGPVSLKVLNLLGQEVARLADGYVEAGRHEVTFDASRLSAGVYLYVIETGQHTATRRMTLLK